MGQDFEDEVVAKPVEGECDFSSCDTEDQTTGVSMEAMGANINEELYEVLHAESDSESPPQSDVELFTRTKYLEAGKEDIFQVVPGHFFRGRAGRLNS